eukprot:TRINITY_DN8574_c0_g1_i1.p1 TRINITY_DN8574_c0_g1~~TRINITY_DN8574_c0_g1_i1.p1  ORF type:complete len:526 (+),score=218.87 TRINITY_DN8574_c0_g1_i1:119-1579(+)
MAEEPSPEVDVGVGAAALSDDEVGSDIDLGDEDDDDDDEVLQDMLRYDSVDEVAKVLHSKQLGKLLESIEAAMTPADAAAATATTALAVGSSEYLLLQDANQMMQSLEADMRKTAKFMIDHYHIHLPELEQMVPDPVLYAKVALAVRDTTDLDPIRKELEGFLEQKVVLSLSYTLSRRRDQHIGEDGWERVKGAAEMTLQLHDARQMLLEYVISRMSRLAPNLSSLVGTEVASQLVCAAGGLAPLAKLNSNIIRTLGKRRRSSTTVSGRELLHAGAIGMCDIVQGIPATLPQDRRKAASMVGNKVALAVRCDSQGGANGDYGKKLHADIMKAVAAWRKPTAAREREKAIKAPQDRTKKRRGGVKARKAKERYRETEIAQKLNRVELGKLEDDDYMNEGDVNTAAMKRALEGMKAETFMPPKKMKRTEKAAAARSSGIATTIAFTPVDGSDDSAFASSRPEASKSTSRYFGSSSTFQSLQPPAPKKP